MAIDNQYAEVQVGQRVPIVQGSTIAAGVVQNQVTLEEVGLILRVQPRVSPDGLVVMQIEAEKSELAPEQEGIPISVTAAGEVVRAPIINRTFAASTVHAMSGQTVVLGGLITKRSTDVHRRVPLLADIPLLGDLFRYDSVSERRTELLVIMTPRVVRSRLDADLIKQIESARMNWVLCDVIELNGPSGLRSRSDDWGDGEGEAVYPTFVPGASDLAPIPIDQPTPLPEPLPQPPNQPAAPPPPSSGAIPSGAMPSDETPGGEMPNRYDVAPASYQQPIPLPPVNAFSQ
jgi:hypothetical protein